MSGGVVLALLASLGVWGLIVARGYRHTVGTGLLPLVLPYAVLFSPALAIALSGRDFTLPWADLQLQRELGMPEPALVRLMVRLTTGLLLVASAEAILAGLRLPGRLGGFRGTLLVAFIAYWLTNVASPSLLAPHGGFEHDFLYPLALGGAIALLEPREVGVLIRSTRNAILVLVLASFLFMALRPGLVLDWGYSRGFLPGVPRFSGLVAHPVLLGGLAVTGLLCLWSEPYGGRRWTVATAAVLLSALLLAQAKLAWVALPVASIPLLAFGAPDGVRTFRELRVARLASFVVAGSAGVALLFLAVSFWTPVGGGVLGSESAGRTLTTLSGRTEIWSLAYDEWMRHPLFGYGSELFGPDYRDAAGADYLTSGHNQIVDTAARAGAVGVFGLTLYLGVLLWGGLRSAPVSAGFSAALLFQVLLWSMTESPLRLFGYGPVTLPHFLLLGLLACGGRRSEADEPPGPALSAPSPHPREREPALPPR